MPRHSLIIGVDLTPIKPISRAITFQSDITSDKCRISLRQHLKSWKADTVLHDGAPNVGTAWVQDAFSQAELVLQALKLATDFLVEGGAFVTKVFRSKDYNALLWVFNQLFAKVEATKPPSSRNVSAEIFVVCWGFKAPKYIDPKFLDSKYVFAEITGPNPNNEAKVFNPEKKRRRRDGYEEENYTQFREVPASLFIQTSDPISMLGSLNRFVFEDQTAGDAASTALASLPETTAEIRQCCLDLKVLGRKEFRMLLRWRCKAREKLGLASKNNVSRSDENEEILEIGSLDKEQQILEELEQMNEGARLRKRREKRRENERKQKEIIRMQMHMMPPTDIGLEQIGPGGEGPMFSSAAVGHGGATEQVVAEGMNSPGQSSIIFDENIQDQESDEGDELDEELQRLYNEFQERKSDSNAKHRSKKARREDNDNEWEGLLDCGNNSREELRTDLDSSLFSEEEGDVSSSVILHQDERLQDRESLSKRASLFFEQGIIENISGLAMEAGKGDIFRERKSGPVDNSRESQTSAIGRKKETVSTISIATRSDAISKVASSQESVPPTEARKCDKKEVVNHSFSTNSEKKPARLGMAQSLQADDWEEAAGPRKGGEMGTFIYSLNDCQLVLTILDIEIITAEAMSLAQRIASEAKSTYDIEDDGYNKLAFRDREGLPEWFLDDEGKHSRIQQPITAAGAAAIKDKLRALNARPIKKVREAKDRKRYKAGQKLEKLRKKSTLLADDDGVSEKDKAQSIAKLLSKAAKNKPKRQVKLVVAKGGNRGISGRPRGVKGRYKIVDARLKKDVRAEKRLSMKRR